MPNHYIVENIKEKPDWLYCIFNDKDMSLPKFENSYLKFLVKTNHAENTVRANAYQISYYMNYLEVNALTHSDVLLMNYEDQFEMFADYLNWLSLGNHKDSIERPCNSTCNCYLRKIFGFYRYVVQKNWVQGNIKVLIDRSFGIAGEAGIYRNRYYQAFPGCLKSDQGFLNDKSLTKDEVITLIAAEKNIRNKLLLLILAETGMRLGEALGIRYANDIDLDKRIIKVEYRDNNDNNAYAKNAEYRSLRISEETCGLLIHYMSKYSDILKKTEYLFVSLYGPEMGSALSKSSVYKFMDKLELKTGIKSRPHMFRHFFANERRKMGVRISLISFMLGHKRISTTEKYFNVELEETLEVQDKYFEISKGIIDISNLIG
ncbi:Site-specific recombinase XerD [Lachnospiraceae bacterium]|nr:Site-specific recombinase XerD [Lachnospiraceae bacterium]